MNPPLKFDDNPAAIRSEIEETRHRMDGTIDALGNRLKGRHLLDEALHFFRTQQDNGNMTNMKNKLSSSADSALHAVVDTIKSNPVPLALIGAGTAWYLFTRTRNNIPDSDYDYDDYSSSDYGDLHFASAAGGAGEAEKFSGPSDDKPGERADSDENEPSGIGERVREQASQWSARASEAVKDTGDKIGDMGRQVRDRSEKIYERSREKVVSTAQEHPLEAGLACLAVGFIAGLLLPAPQRLRRAVAPKARELRERAEDVVNRGKKVIASGAEAAKAEAKTQGITLDARSREDQSSAASAPAEAGTAI